MIRRLVVISLLVLNFGSEAPAGQLMNGGFESGNFNSWVGSATTDNGNFVTGSSIGISPHEGSKQAYFGNSDPEVISQSVTTTVNNTETISFALADIVGGSLDSVKVYFGGIVSGSTVTGGTLLGSITNTGSGYKTYSYTTTATATSTSLSFVIANPQGGWALDAVSVTESSPPAIVPEPSTFGLGCVACVSCLGLAASRRRKLMLGA
jgi:hypothetical protein